MKQHLIGWQVLFYHILSIHSDDGHTQEEVEVISLVVGPARFPHPQGISLREFPLETQQDPPATDIQEKPCVSGNIIKIFYVIRKASDWVNATLPVTEE